MTRFLDLSPINNISLVSDDPLFDTELSYRTTDKGAPDKREISLSLFIVTWRIFIYLSTPENAAVRNRLFRSMRDSFGSLIEDIITDTDLIAKVHKRYGTEATKHLHLKEGQLRSIMRNMINLESGPQTTGIGGLGGPELSKQMDSGIRQARLAGMVLSYLRRLELHHSEEIGKPSLNKVAHALDVVMNVPRSETMKAWAAKKSISHVAAAYFDFYVFLDKLYPNADKEKIGPLGDFTICAQFIGDFLARALLYQEFGLTFVPHGTKRTILDATTIWRVPNDIKLPQSNDITGTIDPAFIEAMREYRAPKAI